LIAALRDDLVEARFQVKRIAVAAIRYPGKHLLVEAEEDQHLAISPMEYDRQPILRHIDSLNIEPGMADNTGPCCESSFDRFPLLRTSRDNYTKPVSGEARACCA